MIVAHPQVALLPTHGGLALQSSRITTLFCKTHHPPPTTRNTIPMPWVVSPTPGATIDGNASPCSPRAPHDAFVLAEDEALAPKVARQGGSILRASLVARGWGKWWPGQEVQMTGRCD